jgi:flagellar hook-basal body complex protein FliE
MSGFADISGPSGVGRVGAPPGGASTRPADAQGAQSFAATLREQLDEVSRVQSEADQKLRDVLTGQSQNVTEVLAAARKAQVAFGMLMEIRNKLVDAYQELQNLRV